MDTRQGSSLLAKRAAAAQPLAPLPGLGQTPIRTIQELRSRAGTVTPPAQPTPVYNGNTAPATTRSSSSSRKATAVSAAPRAATSAATSAATAANNAARSSANSQKSALQKQIDANNAQIGANQGKLNALQKLVDTDLVSQRESNLAAIDRALSSILSTTKAHALLQGADLTQNLRDNEASEGDATFANLVNRSRERQDLTEQATSLGAGESDILKTQLQALRNWNANQADVNRSFYDSQTSINSAITDLNAGTQTNLVNAEVDANAKKGGVFDDFYKALSDAYTQMDNLATNNYLLQGEIDSARDSANIQDQQIAWLDSGKSAESWVQPAQAARTASTNVFTGYAGKAAEAAGSSWKQPDVSDDSKNFSAADKSTTTLNSSNVQNAVTNAGNDKRKRPEGATLRRW